MTLRLNSKMTAKVAARLLLLTLAGPSLASAQDPTAAATRKPNILFIVDTSGSMEYVTGADTYPSCYPSETNPANHTKSRWIEVLEVLTGTFQNYTCVAEDRSSSSFINEFSLDGTPPPDAKYRNPYHRPLSNGCAYTVDQTATDTLANAFDWVPPAQTPYPVSASLPLPACSPAFGQDPDGFIDTANDLARFGLMTFDPLPDPQRGHGSASSYTPAYDAGAEGAWSYYGTQAQGKPADCSAPQDLEVGVRNGAAPATEGKMIYFGDQDLSTSMDSARHARIQEVLLGTRPYGGTPINGALSDAHHFFTAENDLEPVCDGTASGNTLYGTAKSNLKLSPRFDQYVECGCREQHIILITDGEPNLDMRPHCEQLGTVGPDGVCPFSMTAEKYLENLAGTETGGACNDAAPGNTRHKIETHVIGYSIGTYGSGAKDCADLRSDVGDWMTPGGTCDTTLDEDLKVCCTLHRLARAGNVKDDDMPLLAPDAATLRSSLSTILAQITSEAASATRPVRSPGIGLADKRMKAFRLLTSFNPTKGVDGLWYGNIERLRWTCPNGVPTEQDKSESLGDDFHRNVVANLNNRKFVTFVPDSTGGYRSDETLRPHMSAPDDGAGTRGGTLASGDRAAIKTAIPAGALDVVYTADSACVSTGAASDNACRDQIVDWTLGYPDGVGNNRCPTPGDAEDCSVIGDILHSTPTIVDRPRGAVEDDTYETFAENNKGRYMMAYVSSNDGQLHAFAASPNGAPPDTSTDQERYSFIPPAVLPRLKTQYPGSGSGTRMQLLDGVAIVQDVVATGSSLPYAYERTDSDTQARSNTWRTVLVQAFGGQQPGYFALDITDDSNPYFLWQLTTNNAGTPLFGTGGRPIIATVNLNGKETAVAVLPGGAGGSPLGGGCPRKNPDSGSTWTHTHYNSGITGTDFEPRTDVNCYAATDYAARSLTIVRLDNGQILRRFINDPTDAQDALGLSGVFGTTSPLTNPYLDSPITGSPSAYPAGPGLIADRVFVGDQDGTLWRVDVSKDDPEDWTMQLFFDAYAPLRTEVGGGATRGKPIIVPPVLSVDDRGQITINVATGDQDLSGTSGEDHFVYSLTETEDAGQFYAAVNWVEKFENGQHVVGDMTLDSSILYFSTVSPSGTNVCTSAPAHIFGLNYLKPLNPNDPNQGGSGALEPEGKARQKSYPLTELTEESDTGQTFGVSLEYVPSCSTPTTVNNDYIGGSTTAAGASDPPQLQLVFQTSGPPPKGGLGFETTFQAVNLVQNRTASTIQSWAAVLD